jgi:hypothetical protein
MITDYQKILNHHFNVIGIFNLNAYEHCMPNLYAELKKIKKEQYNNEDRIIFELFDHDFYLDSQGPGWALYNLQLILRTLDISNFFCLLLTQQPDYNDYTTYVQKILTTDAFPIRSITTVAKKESWLSLNETSTVEQSADLIKKSYCVLSRESRDHRTFFLSQLFFENLFDHGLIGYHNIQHQTQQNQINRNHNVLPEHISFLISPKHYQRMLLKKEINQLQVREFQKQYNSFKNFDEEIDINNKDECNRERITLPILHGLLYVGLETHVSFSKVFISNISLKGIVNQRPFVLFACPGTIKYLQDLGFRTFNEFWDEGYDEIIDAEERVAKIVKIIKQISVLSVTELRELYLKMKPIIDYNYNFYRDNFFESELQKLDAACFKNLNRE